MPSRPQSGSARERHASGFGNVTDSPPGAGRSTIRGLTTTRPVTPAGPGPRQRPGASAATAGARREQQEHDAANTTAGKLHSDSSPTTSPPGAIRGRSRSDHGVRGRDREERQRGRVAEHDPADDVAGAADNEGAERRIGRLPPRGPGSSSGRRRPGCPWPRASGRPRPARPARRGASRPRPRPWRDAGSWGARIRRPGCALWRAAALPGGDAAPARTGRRSPR